VAPCDLAAYDLASYDLAFYDVAFYDVAFYDVAFYDVASMTLPAGQDAAAGAAQWRRAARVRGRGLHSSTSQLNLSLFCHTTYTLPTP
jgi:hypothetical protein